MSSLRDALAKARLVSEEAVRQQDFLDAEAHERALSARAEQVASTQVTTLEELTETKTLREFRDKARKFLVERPDTIDTVIRLAHRFKEEPGGKRLVWQFFSVREQLSKVPGPKRDRFLRRALRAHAPVMDVPASAGE